MTSFTSHHPSPSAQRQKGAPIAVLSAAALLLSGCAGGVSSSAGSGTSDGVEPRAEFSAYAEALADIEPITLTYQPSGASETTPTGERAVIFKENVEEASGGKITIDLVFGQAIAGYGELPDALTDGRVDLAYTLPLYDPSRFPVTSAFVDASTLTGASPRAEELAANAALLDVAWNSEELLDEFESNGLTPLIPFAAEGTVFAECVDPAPDGSAWDGRQIRVASAAQSEQVEALDSVPVSIEYTETFEGLQRGTVDCTLTGAMPVIEQGFLEVAPSFNYSETTAFGRGAGAIVAGTSFQTLPLAAQQLIFDQMTELFMNSRRANVNANVDLAAALRERGEGGFHIIDSETDEKLADVSSGLVTEEIDKGVVPSGFDEDVTSALDTWRTVVEDMGYGDEGGFDDVDQWHDDESVDFMPFAERVYDDVMVAHRPE